MMFPCRVQDGWEIYHEQPKTGNPFQTVALDR